MYIELWRSKLDWNLYTEPQVACDERKHYWPRGKVLGGTSALNALVYIRGNRANYDAWGPGWSYADVLPYFVKSEDNVRGASEFHGAGGPLHVQDAVVSDVGAAFVQATAARCKVRIADDFNGAEQEGAGPYQQTIRNGMRASTAVAFLDPARERDNLTVITGALATSLVVDGDRITGVRYRVRRTEETIEARQTIVCGGAIGSPQLLMLSGIGAGDELRAVGIDPRHELPGVGKHLQDHLLTGVTHKATGAPRVSIANLVKWTVQHLAGGRGQLGVGPVDVGAFVKSSPAAPLPDIQFHFVPYGTPAPSDVPQAKPWGRKASLLPGLIYPRSIGEIRVRSNDPTVPPIIDPRYFSDPADLEHLVTGFKLAREIANTAPLTELLGEEVTPGPETKSDDDIRAAIRSKCNTIFHPVGTCKMGTDPLAVVDYALAVHGLRGLSVVDASVMPSIIGGNTNAPTIMIAEKAADLLLAAV